MRKTQENEIGVGTADSDVKLGNFPYKTMDLIETTISFRAIKNEDDDDDRQRMEVKLIEKGLSKNKNYYSKKVAESVAGLILERPKMYMDHSWGWFGRSFGDLVALAKESFIKGGASYAIVEMAGNPATSWLYELAKNHEGTVGASIDAQCKVREAQAKDGRLWGDENFDPETSDRPHYIVEKIVFLNSVDFVTYPAAGGAVTKLLASSQLQPEVIEKLSAVIESFEKKVANINPINKEESNMKYEGLTLEALKEGHPDIVSALKEEFTTQSKNRSEAEKLVSGLEQDIIKLKEDLQEAEKDRDEYKTKVDEFELKNKVAAKKQLVLDKIKESKLEDQHVSDVFIEDLMKIEKTEDIEARITDRKELVESSNGEVTDNGKRTQETEEQKTARLEAEKKKKEETNDVEIVNEISSNK